MGMWIDGENVGIDGQAEIVRNEKVAGARRDVERPIVFKLEQHGEMLRRLIREVEPDGGLDNFRFPGRLQMGVEDEIVAGFQTPGETVGLGVWHAAGLPEEKMSGWIENIRFDIEIHSRKPRAW